ncbi:hypothetical protein [Chlamydia sp. 17-3921]|uniref:hypothetical protein n=1 Tax=Chlamydia sp. 17-3921 TaxID=2675798 RepID=UPI001F227D31|nr:hypothetical protein [Chlamydia sp. 17-3921]
MTGPAAPAPCPPPGSNNKYHLTTNPKDSLIVRVLRVIGYILLHIITLGILLLIHYYRNHIIREKGLPPAPIPKAPTIETLTIAQKPPIPEDPKETPPKDQPPKEEPPKKPQPKQKPPFRPIIYTLPNVPNMPSHIIPGSIEAMVWQYSRGFAPEAALFTLPGQRDINPNFVASYPMPICEDPLIPFRHLITLLPPRDPSIPAYLHPYIDQIRYLNENYYIVDVPGDGTCFYHAYAVGWLCSLYESQTTRPRAFSEEANLILQHPFASSSEEANQLSHKVADLLHSCTTCPTLQQLFDSILLSQECTQILVSYLQKIATHAVRQQINILGEENARAAFVADIEEALLPQAMQFLGRQRPTTPFLQNVIFQPSMPLTSASDQLTLLLEYLPWIFLTQEETSKLSPQEQDNQNLLKQILHELLNNLDLALNTSNSKLLGTQFKKNVLDKLSVEEYSHFTRFLECIQKRHSKEFPYSQILLFLACINTSPTLKTNVFIQNFLSIAEEEIRKTVGFQATLAEVLNLNRQHTSLLENTLNRCWEQKLTAELVISFLSMHDSLECAHLIPNLEKLFKRIALLLKKGLKTAFEAGGTLQHRLEFLKQNVEELTALLFVSDEWQQQFAEFCNFSSLKISSDTTLPAMKDTLYTRGMQLFFFILQHPHFLSNPLTKKAAQNIKSLLMPYLQYGLKKSENLSVLQSLATAILGTATLSPPLPDENESEVMKKTAHLCGYFATRPDVAILHPDLQEKLFLFSHKVFSDNSPLTMEAKRLQEELALAYPQLWQSFISHLNILGYQGTKHPQLTPPDQDSFVKKLPLGQLLFSFLLNYPEVRSGNSSLEQQLQTYYDNASKAFKLELQHFAPLLLPSLKEMLPHLTKFIQFKETMISALVRKPEGLDHEATAAFRESFLAYLRSFSAAQLQDLLDAIKQQAESAHVAGLTSALHKPALCQTLYDPTAVQGTANHGFLSAGFASEAEAKIILIRFPNHYGCLLRKPRKPRM